MRLIMRRGTLAVVYILGFTWAAVAMAASAEIGGQSTPSTMASTDEGVQKIGVWQPPSGLKQTSIWPNGAPDRAGASLRSESVLTAETPEALSGHTSEAVFDVSEPTMTVFPPKGKNSGVTIIVFPGGGFKVLAITLEGTEICDWITAKGMTCILSKYRVPKSNHYWDDDCKCSVTPKVPSALQDAQRTIRLVRANAKDLHINPGKIGVMGFSAGGYLVAQTSNIFEPVYKPVDDIDRISSRPDFSIALYPGHLCRKGSTLDPAIHATRQTPPTFLLQAWDDPVDDVCNSTVYARALDDAGVPAEVHLFAKGGHAFGLRNKKRPLAIWPSLVERWMKELGIL